MLKLFFLLMVSVAVVRGAEGTVPFRSGKILSAEVSSQKPEIASSKVKDTSGGVWLELVIKLNPGRTIGRFDYNIEVNGQKYPSRAVARNQERYDEDIWEITDPLENDRFRILFNPPKSPNETYKLTTYRSKPEYPEITAKDKGSDSFTPVSEIPETGAMIRILPRSPEKPETAEAEKPDDAKAGKTGAPVKEKK